MPRFFIFFIFYFHYLQKYIFVFDIFLCQIENIFL